MQDTAGQRVAGHPPTLLPCQLQGLCHGNIGAFGKICATSHPFSHKQLFFLPRLVCTVGQRFERETVAEYFRQV